MTSPARFWTLVACLAVGGCAAVDPGPPEPVVSPTGITYELGTPPSETRHSQTAALYLRSERPEPALTQAREGMKAYPENPIHYFLAGVALARLGEHGEADAMFRQAEELYPAYELDVEPERAAAWAQAFNEGAEAFAEGDMDGTVAAWEGATRIYDLRPEAHRNLAMLLSEEGRLEEAADLYQAALKGLEREPASRVLTDQEAASRKEERERVEESLAELLLIVDRFAEAEPILRRQLSRDPANIQLRQNLALALEGQGNLNEAREIYDDLLSESDLAETSLFNLGVALFRAGDPPRAAEAFERLTEKRPHSRDVWFNYANTLFAAEAWNELIRMGDRLLELDPLNQNAALIVARAHLELGDEEAALARLHGADALPVHVEGLVMRSNPGGTSVDGRLLGNEAEPGSPVALRFTFYGEEGELGSEHLRLMAPPPGEVETFEVSFQARANAYRYEWLDSSAHR